MEDFKMNREAQKILGTQVKELLSKAVGGIYVGRVFRHALTDVFSKFSVTEDGLEITANDYVTFKLPIADEEEYINYAVGVENDEEEWEGSVYFDYCFEIAGYKFACYLRTPGAVPCSFAAVPSLPCHR